MNPEQQAIFDASMAALDKANGLNSGALILMIVLVVALVILSFVGSLLMLLRANAMLTLFITSMSSRGILAAERSNVNMEAQTRASVQQTDALSHMNETGTATSHTVERVATGQVDIDATTKNTSTDVKEILALMRAKGVGVQQILTELDVVVVDVKTLARYAIDHSEQGKQDVMDIATKSTDPAAAVAVPVETPTAAVAASAETPTEALTLPVTVTLTAADMPVVPA